MNLFGWKEGFATKPAREYDEVEAILQKEDLPAFGWRFGARRTGETWRVILQVDHLEYDTLLPGEHATMESAMEKAANFAMEFDFVPVAPGGDA